MYYDRNKTKYHIEIVQLCKRISQFLPCGCLNFLLYRKVKHLFLRVQSHFLVFHVQILVPPAMYDAQIDLKCRKYNKIPKLKKIKTHYISLHCDIKLLVNQIRPVIHNQIPTKCSFYTFYFLFWNTISISLLYKGHKNV